MKYKTVVLSAAFVSLLAIAFFFIPVKSQPPTYGPNTGSLMISAFITPGADYLALNATPPTADILQRLVDKTWVDRWALDPRIQLKGYAEIGQMEFCINNQRWPTGITEPRVLDPKTGTYKHFYDSRSISWDEEACEFRKAIAYLTDKDGYVARILKGFGYTQDTNVPWPALGGWAAPPGYVGTSGYAFDPIEFDPAAAATTLDNAGFVEGSTPNPYWDPSQMWSAEYLRLDPRYGGNLEPLVFYTRWDDPNRLQAGNELTAMLRKSGIQVNQLIVGRTVCHLHVMVQYDYHLYTGGWSLTPDAPDDLYFRKHSAQYWGGQSDTYYGGTGWSANLAGFAHNSLYDPGAGLPDQYYDYWAEKCHYPADWAEALAACREAQAIETNLVPVIPLWAAAAVKAYRSDWTGVQNMKRYGIDNRWSFLEMSHATDTTIDWGICSNLEGLNPVTGGTHPSLDIPQPDFWIDWKVFDLVYDPLIGRNPFNLAEEFGWLAKDWTVGEWFPGKMYATFTLRSAGDSTIARNPTFHNGALVRPLDVAFSLIFMRDCGPGVAWAYSDIKDIVKVGIPPLDTIPTWLVGTDIFNDPTITSGQVKVYFDVKSYWILHWAGMQYVLNERIWKAANDANGWGYTGVGGYLGFTNRMKVRDYNPWVEDNDFDGTVDLEEDGTSAWIFKWYAPGPPSPVSAATSVLFWANTGFYLSQNLYISKYLDWAFHLCGDVNGDGIVDIMDGYLIGKAAGTDMWNPAYMPHGTGWNKYNPDADINTGTWDMAAGTGTCGDGYINVFDLNKWGIDFGLDNDP